MTRFGVHPALFLWVGLILAGWLFAGCAVAPTLGQSVTTGTDSGVVENFGGIRMEIEKEDGQLIIKSISQREGTPRSPMKPGDVIIEINGKSTQGMTLAEALKGMRSDGVAGLSIKTIRPSDPAVASPASLPLPTEGTAPF